MQILALIPARGGSKGIPKKNIVPVAGKPLIAYTIEAALGSQHVDRTVVSSDSEDILEVARKHGAETPFVRPAELAEDATPALPVILHAVTWLEQEEGFVPDVIILLQPTSPLRTAEHIDQALDAFLSSGADSMVSVVKVPHNCSPASAMKLEDDRLTPYSDYPETDNIRQKKPTFYARNGAMYAFTRQCLLDKNSIFGDSTVGYEMPKELSVDIDDRFDLELCTWLIERDQASK